MVVRVDDQPRVVVVPGDLAAAIDEAGLRAGWERLSCTHQRENVEAVESARKVDTRRRRIEGVFSRLAR